MKSNFRLKLFLIMILFALFMSLTISIYHYIKIREQAIDNKYLELQQIEEGVKYSIKTIEKGYYLFGLDTAKKMKESTDFLLKKYKDNPNLDEWDFEALKRQLGFDVYMINQENTITHSSFKNDIGLNFSECCGKLASILDERRESGEFFDDGIDIEQATGELKKYSYMATSDKRYLIQLGYNLKNGVIFKEFNFLTTIQELIARYPSVNDINILNIGGYILGEPVETGEIPDNRRAVFEQTLRTGKTSEWKGEWNNQPANYRYVHYVSDYDNGTTNTKVLEIIYNEHELKLILSEYKKAFIIQLLIILITTILLSLLISKWVAKPMYLAFHDSLTGLKNRAAFDELLKTSLNENEGNTALFMLDLDNFKLVNDYFGHDRGDLLLKTVAQKIRLNAEKEDTIFRLGGDEFIIIKRYDHESEVIAQAGMIISSIKEISGANFNINEETISVSIGIALAPRDGDDLETLYKKADIALYSSKEKGKHQYQLYSDLA